MGLALKSFDERVKRAGGCWLWTGSTKSQMGYGCYYANGKNISAHRYSWQRTYGPIPAGMHVLHRCDNPPCVNPKHLFLGTPLDNMRDCLAKGRARHGTVAQRNKMLHARKLTYRGKTQTIKQWAKELGLQKATINTRLRMGWSVERALSPPNSTGRKTPVTFRGEMLSTTIWARKLGITARALKLRLEKWPKEVALTEPYRQGRAP